jgi:hypothetical protein
LAWQELELPKKKIATTFLFTRSENSFLSKKWNVQHRMTLLAAFASLFFLFLTFASFL